MAEQTLIEMINFLAASEGGLMFGIITMMVVFVFLIAIYIYSAIALMVIANRTKTNPAWLAWIPVANIYLVTQIAKQPGWQTLGILLALIPMLGPILFYALMAFWFWKIAERMRKPTWLGILMIVPIANLVVLGYLAWSK